ncbi:TonB-dependent receptor plug domain-containing protein [Pelagibaculum spongiae]|uniref:TonB-dependent receptor plug domain-containing protein n=1 Tax=Pelagibaculum spongiae TaxID=2080658 RepID=A0A2V1GTL3_9GAMM|nr:TonB-dependent receptor plug domain-containing protein [Pelagibaculum spongiae]PVZ65412.1 hypothetical protein DC094_18190 [Pelagibaculum spongiae]
MLTRKILYPLLLAGSVYALSPLAIAVNTEELVDLELEDLLELEVSIASRYAQSTLDIAAAVYVVDQEDIRRSGAIQLPDVLRLVPGLQVSRVNSNSWSVSARGFNSLYSNKLLVLVNGRPIYSALFSGVDWDAQSVPLEEIERIEVIRGPGAAQWGANAVNGVINIITFSAENTEGLQLNVSAGNQDTARFLASHTGQLGSSDVSYRSYLQYQSTDALSTNSGTQIIDGKDDWDVARLGMTMNWDDQWIEFQVYQGNSKPEQQLVNSGIVGSQSLDQNFSGGYAYWQTNWQVGQSDHQLKASIDYYQRDDVLQDEERLGGLIDYQFHETAPGKHQLSSGISWHGVDIDYQENFGSNQSVDQSNHYFNLFIQDEIELSKDFWYLTLSGGVAYDEYVNFEFQPSIRSLWHLTPSQSLWMAVSRAVRTPSSSEVLLDTNLSGDADTITIETPGGGGATEALPVYLQLLKNQNLQSEILTALDFGLRHQIRPGVSYDISGFYNQFTDVVSLQSQALTCVDSNGNTFTVAAGTPSTCTGAGAANDISYASVGGSLINDIEINTKGVELAATWQEDFWKLRATYTWVDIKLDTTLTDTISSYYADVQQAMSAEQLFSLRASADLSGGWKLDAWLRFQDDLAYPAGVDSYTELDLRVEKNYSWGDLILVGQNLLQTDHGEFRDKLYGYSGSLLERSAYIKLQFPFE